MAIRPTFGTLNASIAKLVGENMPEHNTLVEPFGDGGTIAMHPRRKRSQRHILNVSDPEKFALIQFAKNLTVGDKQALKRLDWISSEETFAQAAVSQVEEGTELFWRTLYIKHFGLRLKDLEAPPQWNPLSVDNDISSKMFGLPLMRAKLKNVEIINEEDPLTVMGGFGGGDTFWVLLPQKSEIAEEVKSRISSLGGTYIFIAKIEGPIQIIELANEIKPVNVASAAVAGIMMSNMSVVYNYEGGRDLEPIDPAEISVSP